MAETLSIFNILITSVSLAVCLCGLSKGHRFLSKNFSETTSVLFLFGVISVVKTSELSLPLSCLAVTAAIAAASIMFRFSALKRLIFTALISIFYAAAHLISLSLVSLISQISVRDILNFVPLYFCAADLLTAIILSAAAMTLFKSKSDFKRKNRKNFTALLSACAFWAIVLSGVFLTKSSENFKAVYSFYLAVIAGWLVVLFADLQNFKAKQNRLSAEMYKLVNQNLQSTLAENEEIRRLRHDMKHYIAGAKLLAENNDNQRLESYFNEIEEKINACDHIETENQSLAAILNLKNAIAMQKGISMKFSVFSRLEQLSDTELFVLFGNLLDNAIEACEKCECGEILLTIFEKCGFTNIEIINSIADGNIDFSKTSKKEAGHGFGIKSVCEIVAEKDGIITVETEDKKAVIRISIPVSE